MDDKGLLIKKNEKTSLKYGKNPYERTFKELLNTGIVVVDKDSGPTSHQATDNLKQILRVGKAGHSGTLDPKVTGVLVVGIEKATRLMEYMLKSDKEYVCLMYVHKPVSEKQLNDAFKKFTGKIMQTPPIVSAVKREEREREVYSIELLDTDKGNQEVLFRIRCQHGTYIRKICSDMGDYLGVGAHMKELRRTKAGPFKEDEHIISLDKLRNLLDLHDDTKEKQYEEELRKYILPMEEALEDFKKVYIRDSAVDSICHGADLAIPGVAKLEKDIEMGEEVVLMTLKGELVGMGMSFLTSDEVMKKKKGAFVKISKVFMDVDTYPKRWTFEKDK